jgi:hypothetical protein
VVVVEGEGTVCDELESEGVVGLLVELAGLPVPVWVISVVAPAPVRSPVPVAVPAPVAIFTPAPLGPFSPVGPAACAAPVVVFIAASPTAGERIAATLAMATASMSSHSLLIAGSSARPTSPGLNAAGRAPVIVVDLIFISVWSRAGGTKNAPPIAPGRDQPS